MSFSRKYCRCNPSHVETYSTMTLGALQREERRLVETIDDYRYFKEDPQKIAALEAQLVALRSVMSPSKMVYFPPADLPETAIHRQAVIINDDIKALRSLEKISYEYGNFEQALSLRKNRSALEETLEHIYPLQQTIARSRAEVASAQDKLRQIVLDSASIELQLSELTKRLTSTSLDVQGGMMKEIGQLEDRSRALRLGAHHREQEITEANKKIQTALNIAHRDLEFVGRAVPPSYASPAPAPVVQKVHQVAEPAAEISLPQELSQVYEATSSDPTIAALQVQLRNAVQDLTESMEDRSPAFIVTKIQARIASLHEEIERRTKKRRRR